MPERLYPFSHKGRRGIEPDLSPLPALGEGYSPRGIQERGEGGSGELHIAFFYKKVNEVRAVTPGYVYSVKFSEEGRLRFDPRRFAELTKLYRAKISRDLTRHHTESLLKQGDNGKQVVPTQADLAFAIQHGALRIAAKEFGFTYSKQKRRGL